MRAEDGRRAVPVEAARDGDEQMLGRESGVSSVKEEDHNMGSICKDLERFLSVIA